MSARLPDRREQTRRGLHRMVTAEAFAGSLPFVHAAVVFSQIEQGNLQLNQ
jgi:hypothetical protein